ncbi:MAG TPA: hypothetical protein VIU02_11940, partial [Burkholderiales bacterium]
MSEPVTSPVPTRLDRLKLYYEKNERKVAAWSFVGGFIFDIVTLDRIDSRFTIGQQAAYILIIGMALLQMFFEEGKPPRDLASMHAVKRFYFEYRNAIVHFILGSLLSLYTLFF